MKIQSKKTGGLWHTQIDCSHYAGFGHARTLKQSMKLAMIHWLNRYWFLKRELK